MAPLPLKVNPSSSSSPSPVDLLTCSVCKGEYCGNSEWLTHLTQNDHQKFARLQCLKKWNRELRSSCLIVFAKSPLTSSKAKQILEYFGREVGAPVNDFVWGEDRAEIGILRFESEEKVKQVMIAVGCRGRSSKRIRIDKQQIYVKVGYRQDKFEWCAMLPAQQKQKPFSRPPPKKKIKRNALHPPPPSSPVPTAASQPPAQEPHVLLISLDTDSDQDNHNDDPRRSLIPSEKLTSQENDVLKVTTPKHPSPSVITTIMETPTTSYLRSTQRPPSPMTRASHPLQFEYWAVRQATLIPDNLYDQGMEAITSLKNILSLLYFKLEVTMFRNWNLKLMDTTTTSIPEEEEELLVFVYKADSLSDPNLNLALDKKMRVFLAEQDDQITKEFTVLENGPDKLQVKHVSTNVKITVVTPKSKRCLQEVQICRLMEYICRFDPRCHGVITLACYWVGLNDIKICDEDDEEVDKQSSNRLHAKYTVPWLVIFFMSKIKLIPTVREILERNPDKFVGEEEYKGYRGNQRFVEEWRGRKKEGEGLDGGWEDEKSEEFILEVLRIFRGFLGFCEMDLAKARNDLILSVNDGLIIDGMGSLAVMKAQRDQKVRMRTKEVIAVERAQEEIKLERERSGGGGEGDQRIYVMIHPFLWDWRFNLSKDLESSLQATEVVTWKMDGFLGEVKREGGSSALFGYESLEKVLTIMEIGMEEYDYYD